MNDTTKQKLYELTRQILDIILNMSEDSCSFCNKQKDLHTRGRYRRIYKATRRQQIFSICNYCLAGMVKHLGSLYLKPPKPYSHEDIWTMHYEAGSRNFDAIPDDIFANYLAKRLIRTHHLISNDNE